MRTSKKIIDRLNQQRKQLEDKHFEQKQKGDTIMLLESLEDRDTLTAKEFDKALDKVNKRYGDVAKKVGVTASAVYQWVHVSNNIPKKHRTKVLNALIKWKEEMEEQPKEKAQVPEPPQDSKKHTEKETPTRETVTNDEEEAETVNVDDLKDEEKEKEEPSHNYDPLKKRRTSFGLNQEICAGAIRIAPWTYSHKERQVDTKFTQKERKTLEAFFNHLEDVRANGYRYKTESEASQPKTNKDLDFALKMLRQHVNHMEDGVIKNMTLQYIDFITEEVN